jgi:beta-lactamase class A
MRRNGIDFQRWASIVLLLLAGSLFFYELLSYSRQRSRLPGELEIAGIPVGGLSQPEALERLLQVYSSPVELFYDDQRILLNPANIGFRLDTDFMLAAAEFQRTGTSFWNGFWDFLWNRPGEATEIPLRYEYSEQQLDNALRDIAARYDQPPTPAEPRPGQPFFDPGSPGRVLDISRASQLVVAVLQSPVQRQVNLPIVEESAARPTMQTLEVLLKQNIEAAGFTGLVDLYLKDLRTGEKIHFAVLNGRDIPTDPDIAFSAASINKISIMTAFFRYEEEPIDQEAQRWLEEMMAVSGNDPSDWLMERLGDIRGPLMVTETLQELGLENTYIAGYYFPGAPLLRTYRTPANQRPDINTDPDPYTQTTPSDIGMLLGDIYECARGGGTLLAVFPDDITPGECEQMLQLLSENILGALLKAGVPDGTRVAHKHGWRSSPLDMIGDTGIVYSPGGDYVISVFLWNEVEMVWDPTSRLIADLSRAAYNFFNPPAS